MLGEVATRPGSPGLLKPPEAGRGLDGFPLSAHRRISLLIPSSRTPGLWTVTGRIPVV